MGSGRVQHGSAGHHDLADPRNVCQYLVRLPLASPSSSTHNKQVDSQLDSTMPALLPPFGRSKHSGGSGHGRPGSLSRSGSSASASVKDKDVKFRSAAPACELFKMLTAMAAGKHASDGDDADLSADPAAAIVVDDVSAGPAAETEGSDAEPRMSESTARSSTETAVDQWMDDTLHQTPRQRDILSARFTGKSGASRSNRVPGC